MTTDTEAILREDTSGAAARIAATLRAEIAAGRHWYVALMDAVARWPLPQEWVDGCFYRYLIGGEAFDWLLLAERLLLPLADCVPATDLEALLFRGQPPIEQSADEFRRAIGPGKHGAHLTFVYGVVVEEALQLAVEEELHKELRCCVWEQDRRIEESVYERIYSKPRSHLLAAFQAERCIMSGDGLSLAQWKEFQYWLFKYRIKHSDPAKLASDTRRGLAQLTRMEALHRTRLPQPLPEDPVDLIEGRAYARS